MLRDSIISHWPSGGRTRRSMSLRGHTEPTRPARPPRPQSRGPLWLHREAKSAISVTIPQQARLTKVSVVIPPLSEERIVPHVVPRMPADIDGTVFSSGGSK